MPEIESAPVVPSSRSQWPKTENEREIAKQFIKQAFDECCKENNQISWSGFREKHPETYDQLLFWAADAEIRVHQLTLTMRRQGILPEIKRKKSVSETEKKSTPNNSNLERFEKIDEFLAEQHSSFPRDHHGVRWHDVFAQYPKLSTMAQALWPGMVYKNLIVNLAFRMRKIGKTKIKRGIRPTPIEENSIRPIVEECIAASRTPKGFVSVTILKHQHPELWAKLKTVLPVFTERKFRGRVNALRRKKPAPSAAKTELAVHVHDPIAAVPVEKGFVVNFCPNCRFPLGEFVEANNLITELRHRGVSVAQMTAALSTILKK